MNVQMQSGLFGTCDPLTQQAAEAGSGLNVVANSLNIYIVTHIGNDCHCTCADYLKHAAAALILARTCKIYFVCVGTDTWGE